jgi:hypothetical protein
MTKKARFIEKLDSLSADEKREVTDFFTKHRNYENRLDWNSTALVYEDFEKVFSLTKNSSRSIKQKAKNDPGALFEKYNCEIISQTRNFLIVVPLDWQCAVFFNTFNCGGEGAYWCIGNAGDASYWNGYLSNKNVFFLIFFVNNHHVFKRKAIIQCHAKNGKCTLWLQNNTRHHKLSNTLKTLNISIEFIQKSAERLLGKICLKDYILDGSTLRRCYEREIIDIPTGVTAIGKEAFAGLKTLRAINIPAGVTAIGAGAFALCESLETITLPAGLTVIEDVTFGYCKNLRAIDIPSGVATIKDGAFAYCKSLAVINIPASITSIGIFSFFDCENLSSITVAKQNKRFSDLDGVLFDKIENMILRYPAGKQNACYTMPDGITAIGDNAFSGCKNLKEIYLSRKISIAKYAFKGSQTKIIYTD